MDYRTIAEAIDGVAGAWPQNGFIFQDPAGGEVTRRYSELDTLTRVRAAGLQQLGLEFGDRLGLVLVEPEEFVLTFLAALRAGIVPVPLYPPLSLGQLDGYLEHTGRVLSSAEATLLLVSAPLQNLLWGLVDSVPSLKRVVTIEALHRGGVGGEDFRPPANLSPSSLAFLQFTSGATAEPKGVMVTHGSLVANARGIVGPGLGVDPAKDVGVSWLPLYHDMGLIGFVIAALYCGVSVVLIPTLRFVKRPSVWLEAVHRHRGTITFAPPFALGLATRRATGEELERWDLSCLRIVGVGAEPIPPDTVRAFEDLFHRRCRMPRTALLPSYGLAEGTLAVTMAEVGQPFTTRRIAEGLFETEGLAEESRDSGHPTLEHTCCGKPFPGHELAIVDEHGEPLPDGRQGEIVLRGPSLTAGYFRAPEATALAFRDGWLHTGDLGYLWRGQLYVTGRLKDLIIVHGRNMHPQAIEWAAAEADGVRRGNVVAFSRPGPSTEEVVVALELRAGATAAAVGDEVRSRVYQQLGLTLAEVICLPAGALPKTSSGKLQRRLTRQQYLAGELGRRGNGRVSLGGTAGRLALVRTVVRALWTRVRVRATS